MSGFKLFPCRNDQSTVFGLTHDTEFILTAYHIVHAPDHGRRLELFLR